MAPTLDKQVCCVQLVGTVVFVRRPGDIPTAEKDERHAMAVLCFLIAAGLNGLAEQGLHTVLWSGADAHLPSQEVRTNLPMLPGHRASLVALNPRAWRLSSPRVQMKRCSWSWWPAPQSSTSLLAGIISPLRLGPPGWLWWHVRGRPHMLLGASSCGTIVGRGGDDTAEGAPESSVPGVESEARAASVAVPPLEEGKGDSEPTDPLV